MAFCVRQEYLPDLIAVSQVGYAPGDGAGADGDHLSGAGNRAAQIVQVLIRAHPATYQEEFHVRHIVSRDHQRHIHQLELLDPGVGVE